MSKKSRQECIYRIASWLAAYRVSTGWTTTGLARRLTEVGQAAGIRVSASSLDNLENNRFGVSSAGAYRHARKPWDRTLKALLLIRSMPDEIRSDIEDLLGFEGRCLKDEIALHGSLPKALVPAT